MSTSVFEICQCNENVRLQNLINENFDILKQLDQYGRSALHYCSNNKNLKCIQLVLGNDFIKNHLINVQDDQGFSALHLACMNGNEVIVKYLCEQGANVNLVDNEYRSLLHLITAHGHTHLFDILTEYRAPMHTSDIYGAFPIHYSSKMNDILLNDDSKNDMEKSILQRLIDWKIDIDCLDKQKRTPFMWAASSGNFNALRLLYKYGANHLHTDEDSLTALHYAVTHGHNSCIRMLIEQFQCPIEGEDKHGCTPLFYSITFDQPDICHLLLKLKANPNHKDHHRRTATHCAILNKNFICLKYLIEFNGDPWIKNDCGDYPLHEGINQIDNSSNLFDIIRYIFQLYPNKINVRNDESQTLLHIAASLGNIELCDILIQLGAKVNSFLRTSAGNYITPYDLARIRCHYQCADHLLTKHGGQRGNFLATIYARRIQKYYKQFHIQKNMKKVHLKDQTILRLDTKKSNESIKSPSLNVQPIMASIPNEEESHRVDNKIQMSNVSASHSNDDQKKNVSNKIIIHTSNPASTLNKLYDRRKLIADELTKLRQARSHNHYIIINRLLYKILIENAFNPHHRTVDDIETYLETLVKAYDTEIEDIRKHSKSIPSKLTHHFA